MKNCQTCTQIPDVRRHWQNVRCPNGRCQQQKRGVATCVCVGGGVLAFIEHFEAPVSHSPPLARHKNERSQKPRENKTAVRRHPPRGLKCLSVYLYVRTVSILMLRIMMPLSIRPHRTAYVSLRTHTSSKLPACLPNVIGLPTCHVVHPPVHTYTYTSTHTPGISFHIPCPPGAHPSTHPPIRTSGSSTNPSIR